jgi:hypothetical protein
MKKNAYYFTRSYYWRHSSLISLMPKGGADLLSSYETIAGAKEKTGKYVHVIAKLDKTPAY